MLRVNKDHDVASLRIADRHKRLANDGNVDPINEFIHQNMIADLQGWLHGTRRNLEGLNDKGSDEKSEYQSNDDGFKIFTKFRFVCHSKSPFLAPKRFLFSHISGGSIS